MNSVTPQTNYELCEIDCSNAVYLPYSNIIVISQNNGCNEELMFNYKNEQTI